MREGKRKLGFAPLAGALCVMGMAGAVNAAITIDGNLDSGYGSPLTTQTVNTGFGAAAANTDSSGGSELDAGYGVVQGSNLDLFFPGNFENNGNHFNLFIAGGALGQSVLGVPSSGALQAMNGSVFSPGFQATYAFDMNDYHGTLYNEEYTYAGPGSLAGGYVGAVGEYATGLGGPGMVGSALIAINNNNGSVMGPAGTAANPAAADAVTTGFEMQIPLSSIGYTGGDIEVLADINGGGNSYLSNQFLPGLPAGTNNLGTSTFNFGATPGQFFTVSVPEPGSLFTLVLGGMMLARRRPRTA